MHARHAVMLSLVLSACGLGKAPSNPEGDDAETSRSDSSGSSTMSTSSETGNTFVPDYDQPNLIECDNFAQDCPDGEKCVPYGSRGSYFDGSKCVPVTGDQAPGEPCTYGGLIEATDDCDESSGCWYVHEVDGGQVGICHAFCSGSADNPSCPAGSSCVFASDPIPAFCIPTCDPVVQDCGAGLGCYWDNVEFRCLLATQNILLGEPCSSKNDCAPGLFCGPGELLPACNDASCCTPFCYLSIGDSQCEAMPGTSCEPFFIDWGAPPGYEDIGGCIVP